MYYTAAHYLQIVYFEALQKLSGPIEEIADLFSEELHIKIWR